MLEASFAEMDAIQPSMIILDCIVPCDDLWNLLKSIRLSRPVTRVLAITCCTDERFVRRAWQAGVAGFVMHTGDEYGLIRAIKRMSVGELVLPLVMLNGIGSALNPIASSERFNQDYTTSLSNREEEVVHLLCQGMTNREIALHMGISENTVRNHLRRVFLKCRVSNRSEAVEFLLRAKLIEVDSETRA